MEKARESRENLIAQFEDSHELDNSLPMHEHLGLDKQLRSICSPLNVKRVKKVKLEQHIMEEEHKLAEVHNILDYTNMQQGEIGSVLP